MLQAYGLLGQLYLSQKKMDQALAEFDCISQHEATERPIYQHWLARVALRVAR